MKKKIRNILRKNIKLLIGIIIGSIIIPITVCAATIFFNSNEVSYDNTTSGMTSTNVQDALDELYSLSLSSSCPENTHCGITGSSIKTYTAEQFYNVFSCDGTNVVNNYDLACDGTSENNLRYVGSAPSNYVTFNGESGKWRIIGVMKGDSTYNTKYSSGTAVYRYKIIRDTIGSYSWDNKPSGTGTSTNSNGSNAWEDARIMTTLNSGPYYNRESGTCYSGINGGTTSCNFSSSSSIPGLTEDAKSMISNAKWNIAGYSTSVKPSAMYTYERGTTKSSVMTTTEWTGRVGLMYPSDYGYAVGGTVRSTCLNTNLSSYNSNSCYSNDWLFTSNSWTLYPSTNSAIGVFLVNSSGSLLSNNAFYASVIRPVLYLDSSVKINGGKGTIDDPFTLSM